MIQTELPKSYTPREVEGEILAKWETARAFHAEPNPPSGEGAPPYCILIPPPNVTAALHLGHAFNNTLQDVLIRHHRMRSFNTLWMPGTDHAGIATQTVVDKRLHSQGEPALKDYKKLEMEGKGGREKFIEKVQAWKDEYEATIIEQLRAMGCSCDFERTRFTMDEMCAKAVREAFFRLFKDGLIYRGKRLVNWDPVTQTALADDEVEMREVDGKFYYLRYPLVHPSDNATDPFDCREVTWSELAARGYPGADNHPEDDKAWVTVATTRPETYLGDTAVAVNPDDSRALPLEGLMVQLPLVGRVIPIVRDSYVVMPDASSNDPKAQYATGFLKVTPAHDPNDYEIGQRHNLAAINVMAPDASISNQHGWNDVGDAHLFIGLSREDARQKVVKEFEARGLLEHAKPYRHSVGHSYRSHVPIEPYLSDQWYVRVTDDRLRGEALRAMAQREGSEQMRVGAPREGDGELRFFPERYAKTFQQWHENLRDWCISRQLWWGHRIPVWSRHYDSRDQWTGARLRTLEDSYQDELSDRLRALEENDEQVCSVFVSDDDPTRTPLVLCPPEQGGFTAYVCVRVGTNEHPETYEHDVITLMERLGFTQDPDVLDTWFSSGIWPLSTMGWPDPDAFPEAKGLLDTFNPSSVLCTAREIITLWVSRMVMFNRYFRDGKLPFTHVYIHAMIQDGHGQKMSKSLGNGVDPRDIITTHGADALRYTLTQIATATQDVRLPVDLVCPHTGQTFAPKTMTTSAGHVVPAPIQTCPTDPSRKMVTAYGVASGQVTPTKDMPLAINASSKFDLGRNFANKVWNATRFALANLNSDDSLKSNSIGSESVGLSVLSLVDRWMLAKLHRALRTVEDAIANYQFNLYADTLYDLVWRDFCDWYLEAIKPTVRESAVQRATLRASLDCILRMLHPIMPFVTEALWPHVSETRERAGEVSGISLPASELAAVAAWPRIDDALHDNDAITSFERIQQLIDAIRTIRGERNVPRKKMLRLLAPQKVLDLLRLAPGVAETMAGLEAVETLADRPTGAAPIAFEGEELLLGGLVDEADHGNLEAERARLTKFIAEKERAIAAFRQKLSNESYLQKAPEAVVKETRAKLSETEADCMAARQALESLGKVQ